MHPERASASLDGRRFHRLQDQTLPDVLLPLELLLHSQIESLLNREPSDHQKHPSIPQRKAKRLEVFQKKLKIYLYVVSFKAV